MKNRELTYIILNLLATTFYIVAFITKNMTILGIGGGILIINSAFDLIKPRKKNRF